MLYNFVVDSLSSHAFSLSVLNFARDYNDRFSFPLTSLYRSEMHIPPILPAKITILKPIPDVPDLPSNW